MQDISVIILTLNEEIHMERCISSIQKISKEIFVVDCFSKDKTCKIAEESGAQVFQKNWPGTQAEQFNWALENLPVKTDWVLRLDADEYITPELVNEINEKLAKLPEEVTGVVLPLRRVFLGRTIKRGTGGIKMLRLFRYGKAICEQRNMDEHIQLLEGNTVEFEFDFVDHNLNNLTWWTQKHNGYAIREAIDLLDVELGLLNANRSQRSEIRDQSSDVREQKSTSNDQKSEVSDPTSALSAQAAAKRRKKLRYAKQPLFWRSFAYFVYRYFFKLGFLEGKEGFLWHFLQGWWYRTLVDAKIWEIKKACGNDVEKIRVYIAKEYGIKV